jgi:uncharacterized OB-fold protein
LNKQQTDTIPVPRPIREGLAAFFWDGVDQGKLLIQRCGPCGHYIHWPREICPACLSQDLAPAEVSGRATLDTWSIPAIPFHPFFLDKIPYIFAVVELPEQRHLKMLTNIVDCAAEDLRIGMQLEVTYREVAPGLTLPLFGVTE